MPHKYHARKTEVDGFVFASKRESERYSELKLLEKAGEITEIVLQPKFDVVMNGKHICFYYADFMYTTSDSKVVVEDVKGVKTDVYVLKRKLVEAQYGITITEVT